MSAQKRRRVKLLAWPEIVVQQGDESPLDDGDAVTSVRGTTVGRAAVVSIVVVTSACSLQVPVSGENLQSLLQVVPLLIGSLFLFLAAGASLTIRRNIRLPALRSRAGRFLLGLFGAICVLYYLPNSDPQIESPKEQMGVKGGSQTPAPGGQEVDTIEPLVGRVSVRSHEMERFAEHRSTYRIHADTDVGRFSEALGRDGQFSFDAIPAGVALRLGWSAVNASEFVLWPAQRKLSADWSEVAPELSFAFMRVHDAVSLRQREARLAIRHGDLQGADAILTGLVSVLSRLGEDDDSASEGLVVQIRRWLHDIHREAANAAAEYREFQRVDEDAIKIERAWRRETIARANTAEEAVLAMNTWATYSRMVYRINESDWPDRPLTPELVKKSSYYRLMRRDLQLIMEVLGTWRPDLDSAVGPPALIGCLDGAGLVVALGAFESLRSSDVEHVNLNRFMNLINGLQQLVRDRWLLGAWVNYPGEGYESVIERQQEREFVLRQWNPKGTESETALTFAPGDSGRCRFQATRSPDYTYTVLDTRRKLRVEYPDGRSEEFLRRE